MTEANQTGLHPPGRHLVLVDEKDRPHLIQVPEPERIIRLKGEAMDYATLAALHDGELLVTPSGGATWCFCPPWSRWS